MNPDTDSVSLNKGECFASVDRLLQAALMSRSLQCPYEHRSQLSTGFPDIGSLGTWQTLCYGPPGQPCTTDYPKMSSAVSVNHHDEDDADFEASVARTLFGSDLEIIYPMGAARMTNPPDADGSAIVHAVIFAEAKKAADEVLLYVPQASRFVFAEYEPAKRGQFVTYSVMSSSYKDTSTPINLRHRGRYLICREMTLAIEECPRIRQWAAEAHESADLAAAIEESMIGSSPSRPAPRRSSRAKPVSSSAIPVASSSKRSAPDDSPTKLRNAVPIFSLKSEHRCSVGPAINVVGKRNGWTSHHPVERQSMAYNRNHKSRSALCALASALSRSCDQRGRQVNKEHSTAGPPIIHRQSTKQRKSERVCALTGGDEFKMVDCLTYDYPTVPSLKWRISTLMDFELVYAALAIEKEQAQLREMLVNNPLDSASGRLRARLAQKLQDLRARQVQRTAALESLMDDITYNTEIINIRWARSGSIHFAR
ncbi:hypothetical protein B0H17DRAFT_1183857 [Mycena rosella]|uniref:Uncharacterized protein n=1 Tax=Mycena rosella TaxID=1033263 RepID=A0AAD7CZ80_MYCRO|nr:hypothetical protein B0H17DRAFT_1183857 [Mycena rosella]